MAEGCIAASSSRVMRDPNNTNQPVRGQYDLNV
jgi:hypothetical protein